MTLCARNTRHPEEDKLLMAASHTLSHSPAIRQISRLGILTLYGYGIRVTMQAGHLQIEDGIGPERRRFCLPRVNHRLKRLVCIGDDGFITLSALKWLTEVDASFVMLDRLGKVRVVTGPTSASESRLRRAQALAIGNGMGVKLARELIAAKLTGQKTLIRERLKDISVADSIAALENRLSEADDLNAIRSIEARAAAGYWNVWRAVPIQFPRKDAAYVPAHWLNFGSRHSPLTGGPRLSVNPANSLLNYTNAVAESECRLAAVACGLDPGIGFLHTDTSNRDSLALDLIETIRPAIEAWLLNWLMTEPLRRSDFFETANGNCRLSSALCSRLSETAPAWGRLVAPWAEYVAHSLHAGRSGRNSSVSGLKAPLTPTHRRAVKGGTVPKLRMSKPDHVCHGCGKPIRKEHEHCGACAVNNATEHLLKGARSGRIAARTPEARAKHSESARKHAVARSSWDASSQPTWLTQDCFSKKIQPLLSDIPSSKIRSCIGVSHWYASKIRQGYCPHPRHWKSLADLAGMPEIADS
jgi:CRISPR-associated endonuclease Cas1